MTKKNSILLVVINIVLALLGIRILYFASMFWMGSKEEYDDLVNNSYWSFFANRLLFNILVGLVFVGFVGAINWLVQKITKSETKVRRVLTIDFLIFIICSIVFIAIQLS